MNILDNIDNALSYIAPSFALKRKIARERFKRLKSLYSKTINRDVFEAVEAGRTQYDFLNNQSDADSAITDELKDLRNHVRQLEYNDGYLAGPLRRLSDHVVGTGFTFQARVSSDKKYLRTQDNARITKVEADEFNYLAEKYFKVWSKEKHCDVSLTKTFSELHWLANLARNRDGEVLIIGRNSINPNRIIPYCQQIVEIDRLETPPGYIGDQNVCNGIRYDNEGVPVVYYVRNRHPGDSVSVYKPRDNDYEAIPAFNLNGTRKVFHLFRQLRPEQTRGFSLIAPGLVAFQNATRYKKAEMFAALEDACMTGIVKTKAPQTFQSNYTETGDDSDKRIHEFSPGKWHYLNPEEDVMIRDPSRPNDKFTDILHSFYEGPANALNMPPEIFLQNWKGMNYSNARTVVIMWLKVVRIEQQYDVDHYLHDTWANVLPQLIAKGLLKANSYFYRKWDYLNSQWIPPKLDWVDPLKEVQGKKEEISLYSETPQSVSAYKGVDFYENVEATARALYKIKSLEEEYNVKMPKFDDNSETELNKKESEESGEIKNKDKEKSTQSKVLTMKK